jgi:hypothetical protein
MFARIGERGYFMRDIGRGLKDPAIPFLSRQSSQHSSAQ